MSSDRAIEKKSRRPAGRRRESRTSDDVSAGTRFVGVSRDRFVGFEVQVTLNWKTEFAAHDASPHQESG